ncbi:MAG: ERF family protein [Cryobacterium sp.]|nr:ERF family protein [Cryobacterium sp.]
MSTAVETIQTVRQEIAPPPSETAMILNLIERAARDASVDIDKMKRLLEMRNEEMDRQRSMAFNTAMRHAQAKMPQVVRDADNDQTKSKYARYETISEAMQPVIDEFGFSLSFSEGKAEKPNHLCIVCEVMHCEGFTKEYRAEIPIDNVGMKGTVNKTATHAYGSTMSYGKRYLKTMIFDVAVKNEDDDGNNGSQENAKVEFISGDKCEKICQMITESGSNLDAFLRTMKIESVADLPASRYFEVFGMLASKIQRKAAQ